MIVIYRASNITEAHIIKGMLEAHGIHARVDGYYLQGGIGELAAMDFVSVNVDRRDIQAASELITAYEQAEASDD